MIKHGYIEDQTGENCKICGAPIIKRCRCTRSDVICAKGHEYHWSSFYHKYHLGPADHSKHSLDPDCCKNKINIETLKEID